MTQGRDLILSIDNVAIASAKGCSLKVQQNFLEACSPTSGRTKRLVPTDYSWELSCDCLIATPEYADSIVEMVTSGTQITVQFYDLTLGLFRYGNAYVASANIDGTVGSLSKLNISLKGSEELDKTDFSNIAYSLTGILNVESIDGNGKGFQYVNQGTNGLYVANKVGQNYYRVDADTFNGELRNEITDDNYTRAALFQGGETAYYLVTCATDTATGEKITNPKVVCKLESSIVTQYNRSWFDVECSAVCDDYYEELRNDEIHVYNILIKRHG